MPATSTQIALAEEPLRISDRWDASAEAVLFHGDCRELLSSIPAGSVQLVVTSPPYNIGKSYESRRTLEKYLADEAEVITLCVSALAEGGSICWQVGNHIAGPAHIVPLDIVLYPIFERLGLKLRNRVVWTFGHGLHAKKRFSGRYETILWFTKGDEYQFDVDPVRVPQKYPGKKYYKGPRIGEYSANPLGKNPGDVWDIPNVKHNHIEKTDHPCQFPVELVERLVLSMTKPGDLVLDPYMGVGTTPAAAVLNGRRGAGAETDASYFATALERVTDAASGSLRYRPRTRPVYEPDPTSTQARRPTALDLFPMEDARRDNGQ